MRGRTCEEFETKKSNTTVNTRQADNTNNKFTKNARVFLPGCDNVVREKFTRKRDNHVRCCKSTRIARLHVPLQELGAMHHWII